MVPVGPTADTLPKVGDHRWTGAAIGGVLGGTLGFVLVKAAGGDQTVPDGGGTAEDDAGDLFFGTAVGAFVGAGFGYLMGRSTPKGSYPDVPPAAPLPKDTGLTPAQGAGLGAAIGARLELERLRDQPGRDPVTGLPDARAFQQRLGEEVSRARRHGVPVAIVHLDLDHFAALNARYGREAGDGLLAEAALVLKLALRESDTLARLPGDAFGAVLPETDQLQGVRAADRIRRVLEEHRFARVGHVTASAGVAASPLDGVEPLELLERAESALSIAKKSGRRKVSASGRSQTH